jgi:beta-lactamase regulating signal transducer with metallopeptidase domain
MTPIGWLLFALFLSAKALLVLAAALWLTHLMRERSAAERHLVWVVASACVLALPALSLAGPSWRVGMPSWVRAIERPANTATFDVSTSAAPVVEPAPAVEIVVTPRERLEHVSRALGVPALAPVAAEAAGGHAVVPSAAPAAVVRVPAAVEAVPPGGTKPDRSWLPLLALFPVLVWLTGSLVVLVRIGAGFAGVRRLAREARPLLDPVLLVRAHGTAAELGVERPVRLLEGDAAAMPITFGVLRPTLLLPSSAREWTRARQDAVLCHELEHVRRRDSLSQLIAELGCALYWFNPLMWWAARRMCVEREHACDDAVLAAGSRASEYAADLVEIARTLKSQRRLEAAAIAMAGASHLRVRVSSLLDARRCRERPSTGLMIPAWIGAFMLLAPLSSVAPATAGQSDAAADAPGSVEVSVAGRAQSGSAQPAGTSAMNAGMPQERDCLSRGRNTNTHSNTNDGRRTITWSGSGCSGELLVEGDVEFDAAFTTITGISRGGRVRITTEENGVERRVTITPANGGVSHDYRVDGNRAAFDDGGREWLSSTLLFAFRRFGFMAGERAAAILARGGPEALLAEVELMQSDYVRARYLTTLIEQGRLSEAELDRVLGLAGTGIDSDHYRTEIITAVAGRYEFTDGVRDAYIRAASGLDSDHYTHAAYSTLLKRGRLTPAQVSEVLGETRRIDSDHYRAQLLDEMAASYSASPAIRQAYLDAVADMDSDHYKTGVLTQLFSLGGMSTADLAQIVAAAATIDSDHYRANVLGHVAQRGLEDAALQQAFLRAAAGIDSDHYLHAVLEETARRDALDESTLLVLLEAAEGIESEHYRSELLLQIAARQRLEGEARTRFERLMNGLESRSRRTRVGEAVRPPPPPPPPRRTPLPAPAPRPPGGER